MVIVWHLAAPILIICHLPVTNTGCNTLPDNGDTCSGFMSNGSHLENKTIPWPQYVQGIRDGYLATRNANGSIDNITNLVDKPVYLFSGHDDVVGEGRVRGEGASEG